MIGERTVDRTARILIAGEWRAAESGDRYEKRNPTWPSEVTGEFAAAGPSDLEQAVTAAEGAFAQWSSLSAARRAEYLVRAAIGPHGQGQAAVEFYSDTTTIYVDA